MPYPDRRECLDILADEGVPEDVIAHIGIVTELAMEIAVCVDADIELVLASAMLHDIGRSRTHGIDHAVEGAAILRERGLPEEVVNIVERHIGAGLTAAEAAVLGLPEKDYFPTTLEQKVVAHADNLVAGDERQVLSEHLESMRRKGLEEQARRAGRLHEELSGLCERDLDELCR